MKYLVVSDLHGSLSGAAFIPKLYKSIHADAILCLGDVLYHGPRNNVPEDYAPKKIIEILSPLAERILAVRGNCEADVDQMVLPFPVTADYNSFMLGKRRIFMTHGHIYGPGNIPKLAEGDVLLSGHTHIPTAEKKKGIYLLNPGSTALPKENHPATYGILEKQGFRICTRDGQTYMHISFEE